jgi:quercetin dioxygenase-like cupin family protein
MVLKEIELSQAHITADFVDYKANSVLIKPIVKRTFCDISIFSYDAGVEQDVRTDEYDSYAQIIEGRAVFVIDGISHILETGQSIMIPAHSPHSIVANGRFKMVMTVIK